MVSEQQLHDEVNLARLVRRLEKSIADPRWTTPNANDTWIKAQSSLQVSISRRAVVFRLTCLEHKIR